MVNYRRSSTAGACYFFTVNLHDRKTGYLSTYVSHLHNAFHQVREKQPFKIIAAVILPDHLHMIMVLPEGDANYPGRWRAIKSLFTRSLVKEGVGLIKNNKGEYNLWQRRYWEHQIRDNLDMQRHIDYIHFNPVKHGHVNRVKDWPHSTFHRYVDKGVLDKDWGNYWVDDDTSFGE